MSHKRQIEDDGKAIMEEDEGFGYDDGKRRRKVPSLRNVVLQVMEIRALQRFIEPVLEPLIRKVVREEIESALQKHVTDSRNAAKEIQAADARSLKLHFLDNISLPVFTGARIEGEDGTAMKVALLDAITGQVVCNGPVSSAKVEIVVLEGDFDGNVEDDWTPQEFRNNVVRERVGKKAILNGDVVVNLNEGTGVLHDICFTDNSSWTRSRKFRLGARVLDHYYGINVREAKTDSFIVRDHRGELYKKHYPPSLFDEVWRLEKIGKEGAFHKRLSTERIKTVKDFLILLNLDPSRLRYILGSGMTAKVWEVTVEHAKTCVLDKTVYMYCPKAHEKNGVLFNVVGQLKGLLRGGLSILVDKLSQSEMADAHKFVILAFKKWEEVVAIGDETSLVDESSLLSDIYYPSNSPLEGSSNGMNILTSNNIDSFDYPQVDASTPYIMPSIYSGLGLHTTDSIDVNSDHILNFPSHVTNSLICDAGLITPSLSMDDRLQSFNTNCSFQSSGLGAHTDLYRAVSEFLDSPMLTVTITRAQMRWRMLFSVTRWFSVRRIVSRRSMTFQTSNNITDDYIVSGTGATRLLRPDMQIHFSHGQNV